MQQGAPMIPCLRCSEPFEGKRFGPSVKYCAECRRLRKNEADRDRRQRVREDQALLHRVAESLREYVTPDMWQTIQDYIANVGAVPGSPLSLVVDRMPAGTATHAGPDEGVSTTNPMLAQTLEGQRMRAIMDDWFVEHPHWLEGVND